MKTSTMLMYAAAAYGAYYLYTHQKKAAPAPKPAAKPAATIPVDQVSKAQVDPVVDNIPMVAGLGSLSGHCFS
jgi:hypothetical protein